MMNRRCHILDLGFLDYQKAWDLQKELVEKRFHEQIPDTLILVEHPSVFTIGRSGSRQNIHVSDEYLETLGIPVLEVDRGGDITYHGPGQLIGYPILDLTGHRRDVHLLLRRLEEVLIRLLADYGVKAGRAAGYTGVWVEEEKIASIGIGVRRWISFHGFCLNVNPDMKYFSMISPCGITDKGVTSLAKISRLRRLTSQGFPLGRPPNGGLLPLKGSQIAPLNTAEAVPYGNPNPHRKVYTPLCYKIRPHPALSPLEIGLKVSGQRRNSYGSKLKENSQGIDLQEVKERLIQHFGDVFGMEMEDDKRISSLAEEAVASRAVY